MGIEKKVLSVRLNEKLIGKLKAIDKDENRPLSNFIETVLKKYVSSKIDFQKSTKK